MSASLLLAAMLAVHGSASHAQTPDQPAPPDVAARMTARAEQFLRAVADLSPVPAGTDADRAQAWPREPFRAVRAFADSGVRRYPRSTETIVRGDPSSGDPAAGVAWMVTYYGGEIALSINSQAGTITSYHDQVLSNVLSTDPAPDGNQRLSRDVALDRAMRYLSVAGLRADELALRSETYNDSLVPPSAAGRTWDFVWDRSWRDVLYDHQSVVMELDAQYGRLLWFGAAVAAPPPAVSELTVLPVQAADAGARFLAGHHWRVAGQPTIALRVVMPTDSWTSVTGHAKTRATVTRLAWIVRTPLVNPKDAKDASFYGDVWVDAANGDILGGGISQMRGGRTGTAGTAVILTSLGRAEALIVRPTGKGGGERRVGPKPDPLRFYGALSQLGPAAIAVGSARLDATHTITIMLAGGASARLDYDARAGLVGDSDGHAAKAGPALRALVEGPPTAVHSR